MAQVENNPTDKGERPKLSQTFRQFKGVYTKSDRTAMPQDRFYDLTNIIPLGPANAHTVENISASLHDYAGDTIYYSAFGVVASVSYQFNFASNGKLFAYNYSTLTSSQINSGHLFSGAGSFFVTFYNKYALFVDSTGYYSWDGTTFSVLTGGFLPTLGTDIAVYGGRVWIASGRLITISAAYDGTSTTDPTNSTGWDAANGATFLNMTDPALQGIIVRLWPQNGYLYIFGTTCVFAISGLYVPYGAVPPTPAYTITNVQSIIGTDQPYSVFAYNRLVMFANRFGAWAISGVDAQRVSEDIDGTWQYLAFNPAISGGQCVTRNILCAAFLLKRSNDPVFGSNTVVGMWFDGQWFFANFGTITLLSSAIINATPAILAFIGNKMYQLFEDRATTVDASAMTPQWPMEDPLAIKTVVRAGAELLTEIIGGTAVISVDSVNSSAALMSSASPGELVFLGSDGNPLTFLGAGSVPIVWVVGGMLLQGSPPGAFSQYVGLTLTTTGLGYQLAGFFMDYKLGARWTGQ